MWIAKEKFRLNFAGVWLDNEALTLEDYSITENKTGIKLVNNIEY